MAIIEDKPILGCNWPFKAQCPGDWYRLSYKKYEPSLCGTCPSCLMDIPLYETREELEAANVKVAAYRRFRNDPTVKDLYIEVGSIHDTKNKTPTLDTSLP